MLAAEREPREGGFVVGAGDELASARVERDDEGLAADLTLALALREPYGFTDGNDERAFAESPRILLRRAIAGPIALDLGYRLDLVESIVDAGAGADADPGSAPLAIVGATLVMIAALALRLLASGYKLRH